MEPQIIGIDVGGTNTDAALIRGTEVIALIKIPTNHEDLLASTKLALEKILKYYQDTEPLKLHLSTTLSTNIIVEGRGAPVKVCTVPGPGVNLRSLEFPFSIVELDGYIDHRGREIQPLCDRQISSLADTLKGDPTQALAVVGKFSQRNPSHEQELAAKLGKEHMGVISQGHRLSGRANFPRRIVTTYLNASVARHQEDFLQVWRKLEKDFLDEILILKADGGTMTLEESAAKPVESILSGPAASIMGVKALSKCQADNYLVIDIGGTTTDLVAVVDGEVLYERDGATISGYKTLVPAVLVRSIGLGGDSSLRYTNEQGIIIGPKRAGVPVCLGGKELTPTDAAVVLGLVDLGCKQEALAAWKIWGQTLGIDASELAKQALEAFSSQLNQNIINFYAELENMPLYTVHDVLHPPMLAPQAIVGLGAPAPVFIPQLAKKMDLPWEVLPYSAGANAVGAAAAQVTVGITLQADTELGRVTIPELGYLGDISRPLFFDLKQARKLAKEKTAEYAQNLGIDARSDIYVVEEESFQMVRGFRTVGQTHMVRTQLRPQVRRLGGKTQ